MLELKRIAPSELPAWLGAMNKGIMDVVSYTDRDDYPYPKVLLDMFRGLTTCFIGLEDGKYKGFILLTPCALEFGARYLLISAMYSILRSREEWDNAYETVKAFAQEHGCQWIEFRSERHGWDRVAPFFGFDKTYSIYRRSL